MTGKAVPADQEQDPRPGPDTVTARQLPVGSKVDLSSELLDMLVAVMPDSAVVVDGEGHIAAVNWQAEALFGYSAAELNGRPIEVLIPERFRHAHRGHRAGYLAAPRTRAMGVGLDLIGRRKDGTEFPVDISLAPVGGADRLLIVAAVRDLTEAKAATAAQAQLAAIVESSLDGILTLTLDGNVMSWNPGATRLLGYQRTEILGQHVSRLLPPDGSPEFEELLEGATADRPTVALDTQWLTKEERLLDVAISVSPLRDQAGRLIGFSVLLQDITARKRAESRLKRQERRQSAMAEIRLAMLSNPGIDKSLELICARSCELVPAQSALIVATKAGPRVVAAAGSTTRLPGEELSVLPPVASEAVAKAETQIVGERQPAAGPDSLLGPMMRDSRTVATPMLSDREVVAVLILARSPEMEEFGPDDIEMVEAFALQGALAFELARAREISEQLLLAGDRERIGRDLHDLVIQRLFGTGMGLQSVLPLISNERAAARVTTAIDDLDATIREIRTTIFELELPASVVSGLRSDILLVVAEASESLGFEPTVHFGGPIDSLVADDVKSQLLAVAREALSNVARHAHAKRADVDLQVGDEVLLVVSDDGVGLGESRRRSGLANVAARAERLGGTFHVGSPPEGGTRLEWRVPLIHGRAAS